MPCYTPPPASECFERVHGRQAIAVACWLLNNANMPHPSWLKTWEAHHKRRDQIKDPYSQEWYALEEQANDLSLLMRNLGV